MIHNRIADLTAAIARLDQTPDSRVPKLDKGLRNLVSRHYIPPVARDGRADLYDATGMIVLRLAERAQTFGLDRASLESFIRFLQSAPDMPQDWREGDGKRAALTRIEIALNRARAGEDFYLGLAMGRDGALTPVAEWQESPVSDEAAQIIADYRAATGERSEPDAVLRLPAGRLIREILDALGA